MAHITDDLGQITSVIKAGGVVICPTEGVYGLSCDPRCLDAVARVIELKQRAESKGLILVGESLAQVSAWVNWPLVSMQDQALLKAHWPGPVTFILPLKEQCSSLICGQHNSAALRVTAFPTLSEICFQVGGPVISTSANLSGQNAVSDFADLNPSLLEEVDLALDLPCGGACEPTAIYDTLTQRLLRPSTLWSQLQSKEFI